MTADDEEERARRRYAAMRTVVHVEPPSPEPVVDPERAEREREAHIRLNVILAAMRRAERA